MRPVFRILTYPYIGSCSIPSANSRIVKEACGLLAGGRGRIVGKAGVVVAGAGAHGGDEAVLVQGGAAEHVAEKRVGLPPSRRAARRHRSPASFASADKAETLWIPEA
jgi:hypothetical protein